MSTAEKLLKLFDADLELDSIFDFHDFINDGIPIGWAVSFFEKSGLQQQTSEMFPSVASEAIPTVLSHQESQTLFHLARLYTDAIDFFGDNKLAETWLSQPSIALGERSPIELVGNSVGFELVSSELQRLSFGLAG